MTLRIISYNVDGFQAIWLTLKQDPRAGKARATLDREVKCHFLDALASLDLKLSVGQSVSEGLIFFYS